MPPACSTRPIPTTTLAHCQSNRRWTLTDGWLHIRVDLPGRPVELRVWQARRAGEALSARCQCPVQQCRRPRHHRQAVHAGSEIRILQEIVLGVGGWRVVETLHPEVEICHLNEGHAAFAVLERVRAAMRRSGRRSGRLCGQREREICSPPIRRWQPGSTGFRPRCSRNMDAISKIFWRRPASLWKSSSG